MDKLVSVSAVSSSTSDDLVVSEHLRRGEEYETIKGNNATDEVTVFEIDMGDD